MCNQNGPCEVLTDASSAETHKEPALATKKKTEAPNEGTISEIKDRVGDDPEAAAAVLEAEQAEDDPRSTLIEDMTAVIEDAEEAAAAAATAVDEPEAEDTVPEPEPADDPAPAAAVVTGDDEDGDDTVLVEEEVLSYGLMRHSNRIITTVAVSPGQRVSKARLDQIEARNAEIEEEAERRKQAAADAAENPDEEE